MCGTLALMQPGPNHRKTMKRREIEGDVRFITFSCEKRLPLLGNPKVKAIITESIFVSRARFGFELFAWVIMPEHVHVLVRPRPPFLLDRALLAIKLGVSRKVIKRWKELNAPILERLQRPDGTVRFWQKGGGFDRNVRTEAAFCREVRYIHRNPVQRGLVAKPEDWSWSSVHWWMNKTSEERGCDPPPGTHAAWDRWRGFL